MNCTYLCFTRIFIQWSIRKLCIHKMATIDCFVGGDLIINMGDNFNWFNPTTSLCLSQLWIWISNAICLYGLFVLNGWRREVIYFSSCFFSSQILSEILEMSWLYSLNNILCFVRIGNYQRQSPYKLYTYTKQNKKHPKRCSMKGI